MKKKVLSILLALVMVVSLVPERVMAGQETVTYLKWDDTKKKLVEDKCESYTTVSDSTSWTSGWYVVSSSVDIDGRVTAQGDVHLILCDGVTLKAEQGINVSETSSLTIYGQKAGTGELIATAEYYFKAGIGGGSNGAGGSITINGGNVTATGGVSGAGIGGGSKGAGGSITINGGNVTATGGEYGAGIGGGEEGAGGSITITGGEITATGGVVGIGGSAKNNNDKVVVNNEKLIINAGDSEQNTIVVPNEDFKGDNSYKYVRIEQAHTHDNITFKPWSEGVSLPSQAGNYYLTTDVTLSGTWTVSTGTTNLCLNGHKIIAAGGFSVSTDRTLNIYDCNTTTVHKFNDTNGYWKLDESGSQQITGGVITADGATNGTDGIHCVWIKGGSFTLNGGSICGSNGEAAVYVSGGQFTMNGGNICGNKGDNYGGGVRVSNGTCFTMTGGSIHHNQAGQGGGVFIQSGTLNMTGGEIKDNIAKADEAYGGGVFATKNAKVTVGGNAIVKNNKVVDASVTGLEQSNIHLQDNNKQIFSVLSDPSLTDDAAIGVTLYISKTSDWKPGIEVASYFGNTLTSDNYKYFTINNSGSVDKGTVYRVAQIGTSPDLYYVRGGNFSVTGYTDPATPSLGSVTPDETTCEDGATVTLSVSPTTGYMLTEGSLKASYTDPADAGESIECVLTKDAQDSSKYTFTMPAANVTVTAAFEKLAAKVSKVPEAVANLVYSGEAQALVTAGEAENGTMQYALGENATTAPATGWSATISTGISADTYYVWYKAAGSDGALDSAAACVTVTISKRVPAAPSGLAGVKPSEIGKNDGKITGTTTAMEYGTDVDFSDAKPCTGDEITGLAAGTYYVRIKETANESAGNYVSVTVSDGDKKNFTTVVIDNYSGVYDGAAHGITVSGVPAGATVMYGTTEGTYDMDSISYTDFTDGAKTVFVKVSAENYNNWFGSGTVTIAKRVPAAPSGLAGVKPSEIGKNDGKITGTTAAMEYSTADDFSSATDCTGTEITGLAAGTYYVRIKETANESAGDFVSVTVSDGDKKNFTTVVIDNYNGVYDGEAHGITVSGVPAGATVKFGTVRGTYDMDSVTYTDVTNGAKTVFVRVTAENYNDWFGSGTVTIVMKTPTPEPPVPTPEPPVPTPELPITTDIYEASLKGENTVKVEAVLKNGNADIKEIASKELEEIFSEASDGEAKPVTVDLSRTKQEISSVTLTKKSIENIAKAVADESSPADSLEVKLTNANMTLDGKAVEAVNGQAKGDDISLIVAAGRDIELNEAQQKVVENENVVTVVDVRILSNGREIHEFNGGIITFEIDPDSKKLSDLKHCFVKYVSENGKLENVETSYDGKHIIFKTGHLSKYVIVYDESGENGTEAEAVKNVKAPYIKLSKTIGLGNTFNMAVTNVADNASVKYSSSDRKVATVDRNGVITAVGIGKCTVKGVIKQNGTTYKFAVAVSVKNTKKGNRHIKEDECLTPNSLTPLLNIYKAVSIAKPLKLNLKRLAADAVVTYSSEDESIAGVSEDGVITGHKKGYTGIDVYVEQNGQILQYRVFVRVSGK